MKNKIIFIVFALLAAAFLSACGTSGPKHFGQLDPARNGSLSDIPTLPQNLSGQLVIHTPNGTLSRPTAAAARPAPLPAPAYLPEPAPREMAAAPSYDPSPLPLSLVTRRYLDEQAELHRQGQHAIIGVEARWPNANIPRDHLAYSVQDYLKARGISVGIEPSIRQSASKTDAGLKIQR